MHLSNILLVLSLSTPFFSTLTASPAYLEVDTVAVDTATDTFDSIDPEIDVISPFQAYDDDVLSYLIDDEGPASVVRRSRSRSQVARSEHAERQCEKRAVADWTYVGCTVDGEKRALPYLAREGGMTPQRCIAICEAQSSKYVYAGVQYATQCFCGEKLLNGQGAKVAESQCNTACGGDNKQKCGGAYRNGLYQRKATTTPTPSTTTKPTSTSTTAPAATSTSAGSTYPVTGTIQTTRRLGCFSDSSTSRMLTGVTYRQNDNTPDRCWTFCVSKGYLVAGVQSGPYCYCGNTVDWARKVPDGECNMACPGGGNAKCGAGNRNEVYTRATNIKVGTPAVPSSGRKYLWAHHMIGNTYSYNQDIWRNDITLAADAGIDGFALNMGRDDWQPARVADAYAVARSFGSSFKLFFSLDMTSFSCSTAAQAVQYATLVSSYRSHPNQAFYQNKLLLTLFDGAYCTFGQANVNAGWAYFRAQMTARNTPVYIMPSLFVDLAQHNWYDGHFDWDNSWPEAGQDLDGSRDVQAQAQMTARGKGYMPGISPNFFTYYSPQTYNKNWIYRSDDWLMASRFEQIIQQRASHDMAELITWNDFGESHYVGPIRPDQPNSQGWTNGMPHTGWLHLIRHYAQAYRTGTYHSARDSLYLWSRPHPKSGNPTNVSPGLSRPRNADYTEDNLYVVAILSTASDVVVTAGTNTITYKNLPAGLNKISVASGEGSIGAQIVRGGATVRNYSSGTSFKWSKTFRDWNFNYFVASAE